MRLILLSSQQRGPRSCHHSSCYKQPQLPSQLLPIPRQLRMLLPKPRPRVRHPLSLVRSPGVIIQTAKTLILPMPTTENGCLTRLNGQSSAPDYQKRRSCQA